MHNFLEIQEIKSKCLNNPDKNRTIYWRILLNQLPLNVEKFKSKIFEKKKLYDEFFDKSANTINHKKNVHQIQIDLKRLKQSQKTYENTDISSVLFNILITFSLKWPNLGYVQGMSDLLVPIVHTFCQENIETAESSSFFIFTELIEQCFSIFDSSIYFEELKKQLIDRDLQLSEHFDLQNINEKMYSVRWINCFFYKRVFIRKQSNNL